MQKRRPITPQLYAVTYGFLLFIFLADNAFAQPSYIFTSDTGPYADLAGAIPLSSDAGGALSDTNYLIDLGGETLKLYGQEYSPDEERPLLVDGSGFIRFDSRSDAVVIDGFLANLDRFDGGSRISYAIEQGEEERILKVEWKRVALIDSPEVAGDYLSFQVWLYQRSGVVELRYGPRMLHADSGVAIGGGPFVGIFRFSQVPVFRIFEKNWLIGNPFAPTYDTTRTGFSLLEGCPREGTIFRFTPRVSSGVDPKGGKVDEGMGDYRLFPNPTEGRVTLQALEPLKTNALVRLTDALGRIVEETEMPRATSALNFELPCPGTYFCEIRGEEETQVYSIVRQ